MILDSKKTDPKISSPSNYARVTINQGEVVQIEDENGREGGTVWSPDWQYNGDLQECMNRIADDFPNLYRRVFHYADKNSLMHYDDAHKANVRREIGSIEAHIKRLEQELEEKKERLQTLKGQL
jgi:hypothetical protein